MVKWVVLIVKWFLFIFCFSFVWGFSAAFSQLFLMLPGTSEWVRWCVLLAPILRGFWTYFFWEETQKEQEADKRRMFKEWWIVRSMLKGGWMVVKGWLWRMAWKKSVAALFVLKWLLFFSSLGSTLSKKEDRKWKKVIFMYAKMKGVCYSVAGLSVFFLIMIVFTWFKMDPMWWLL